MDKKDENFQYTTVNGVLIGHGLKNGMKGQYSNWLIEIKRILCYTEFMLTFNEFYSRKYQEG